MYTEEEANKQQCRALSESTQCISSHCMHWRWSHGKEIKSFLDDVHNYMLKTGDNFNKAVQEVWKTADGCDDHTEGYCGLAGKPE